MQIGAKFPLFNNGIWQASATKTATGRLVLLIENLKNGFCDWPIKYDDGHIAYDYPERIPEYIKGVVRSLLRKGLRDRWARLEDCENL